MRINIWRRLSLLILVAASARCAIQSEREQLCREIFWLHVPKTSSTLCATLYSMCCEALFEYSIGASAEVSIFRGCILPKKLASLLDGESGCPNFQFGPHTPLDNSSPQRRMITIFREPKARLVSSYLDGRHHEGMDALDFMDLKNSMDSIRSDSVSEDQLQVEKFALYANHKNSLGCYAKMLLGYEVCDCVHIALPTGLPRRLTK